jgi:predicted transcriptional regulator
VPNPGSRRETLIDVEINDDHIPWLVADKSIEKLDDGTYRMTEKGAKWFSEWCQERLGKAV